MTTESCNEDFVDSFAADVFNAAARKRHLSPRTIAALEDNCEHGASLTMEMAEEIAHGMKEWAMEKGATHFTHWFQPLTGATAEKHDSFLQPDFKGGALASFSGKELIRGEPDASSFPSGGLRATFEARGYTAWDPTSPAFVMNARTDRAVLCIPCVFMGYYGESLDEKTPLLRSQSALVKQVRRVAALFETDGNHPVQATLGPEQEYFLIDSGFYYQRPDLVMCSRTLFGNRPARHQQMEDHYFGRIKPRILAFMADVDRRLWRLGVPAKTRHNEVSPAQFELAPIFEEQNLSVDHNMLVMQVLRDVAEEHDLVCLLHEKPFAGVNGSGKHNNWSIVGPDGKNWFDPGKTPHENAKFLFMLAAVIKAVDTHAPLIRAAVATAGNDHRLGANEAPPAIMSIYLGEQLDGIVDRIDAGRSFRRTAAGEKEDEYIEIGVDSLPKIPRDVSDRNRTSPFAFTGNKFEFRAVGSSQSCAGPNTTLNLIMAAALDEMATAMEKYLGENPPAKDGSGHSRQFHDALNIVLRREIKNHKRVLYSGDGYSEEWRIEAAQRGLPHLRSTPGALMALLSPEAISLYGRYGVLSERELASRYEVFRHAWEATVTMEGGCALDVARTFILPAALDQERRLAQSLDIVEKRGADTATRAAAFNQVVELVDRLYKAIAAMDSALAGDAAEVVEAMAPLRTAVDNLEAVTADKDWPFPCYGEIFFSAARAAPCS